MNRSVAGVLSGTALLLGLWAASAVPRAMAKDVVLPAELNADLGFPQRSVRLGDLGLKEKEVLKANLFDSPMQKAKFAFDEKMLMMAIAGMANRDGPKVFLDATPCGWRGDATWIRYYGETHGYRFVHLDHGLPDLIGRTAALFNGIILYDPTPSDNIWLAMNLASLNFCLPVSRRIYDQYQEHFGKLPIVLRLPKNALSREQIYDWLVREVLPRTDRTAAYTPAADFSDIKLYAGWEEVALGLDYPFYRKMFMFNISPLAERLPGFGGADGSPAMARQYRAIMQALQPPAAMFGWSVAEAEFSQYGHFQCNAVVATNLSFHAGVKPLAPPPFRQNLTPRIATPEKKIYLSFVANEGDTLVVLTQLYYGDGWLDSGRGKVPLNWAVNPYFAKLFPALVEYYFRTKTDKDYFVCGPSGAGYVHPDSMSKPDLERFVTFTNRWMNEGITQREIVLWEARDPDVWATYARGIPNLRGLTVKPEEMYPYGEMLATSGRGVPVLREALPTQYWHANGRFINKNSPKAYDVKIDEFVKFLDELDQNVEKPYCLMVYGLQNNLPTEIARIQEVMDRNRFEIVDLGTLCHLAGSQSDRIELATAQALDPRRYAAAKTPPGEALVWTPQWLTRVGGWQSVEGAILSADQRGLRIEIGLGRQWGRANLSGVLLPKDAARVRIGVSEVHGCHWALRIAGTLSASLDVADIQGIRTTRPQASWCPFSEWSSHRRWPGSEERPLDKAFVMQGMRGEPVTLTLEVAGAPGGYAVFESLEIKAGNAGSDKEGESEDQRPSHQDPPDAAERQHSETPLGG